MRTAGAFSTLSTPRTLPRPRWSGGWPAFPRSSSPSPSAETPGLKVSVEKIRRTVTQEFEAVDWSDELPRLLRANHLVISKAGGATVQEAMSAACPMIVNHVIPGQEEGNARFIMETKSGTVALNHDAVIARGAKRFRERRRAMARMVANISQLGRPTASLDIAKFLALAVAAPGGTPQVSVAPNPCVAPPTFASYGAQAGVGYR